ncbi:hypothetical protein [Brachybacterium sp. FME24]|uniref:hypothetical protein n=1 Tax=Brachybacterium sp. FME24 TaxID=2742605 RepID=UPI0018690357|nr:hypothetical protein [Brachybacterium sp. FME24]
MPTPALVPLRSLSQFALDAAVSSAFGAIPVGRLHGRQVVAWVAASATVGAAATFLGLQARARARTAIPDGWKPWTPQGQAASALPVGTVGDGTRPRGGEDRRALLRRSAVAVAGGTLSGCATAFGVALDRRMEAFFTDRGVRHPRLAVGLSQGIGYAGLVALVAAVVEAREDPENDGDDG